MDLLEEEARNQVSRARIEAELSEREAQVFEAEFLKSVERFQEHQKGLLAAAKAEEALAEQTELMNGYLTQFNEAEMMGEAPVVLIEEIAPACEPVPLRTDRTVRWDVLMGVLVSAVFGIGLVLLADGLDFSMEVADRIERELKVSVLGAIPHHLFSKRRESRGQYVESYRLLRTHLSFALAPTSGKILLVTSSGPREGKSTTAANMAIIWAQSGKRVLLVDCDLMRPTSHKIFGCPREPGLAEHLSGTGPEFPVLCETGYDGVQILPAGRHPAGSSSILLENPRMVPLLAHLREAFDVILLDCTPVLGFSHVLVMATHADGILFLVEAGRYTLRQGREALTLLKRSGTPILGVCLNKIDLDRPGRVYHGYYRYYSHYRYYSSYAGSGTDSESTGLIEIKEAHRDRRQGSS